MFISLQLGTILIETLKHNQKFKSFNCSCPIINTGTTNNLLCPPSGRQSFINKAVGSFIRSCTHRARPKNSILEGGICRWWRA